MSNELDLHYDCMIIQKHLFGEHGLEMSEADIRKSYSAFCEEHWCAGWIYPTAREIDNYYHWLKSLGDYNTNFNSVETLEMLNTIGVL